MKRKNSSNTNESSLSDEEIDLYNCDFDDFKEYIIEEINTYSKKKLMNLLETSIEKGHYKLLQIILMTLFEKTLTEADISKLKEYLDHDNLEIHIDIENENDLENHVENIEVIINEITKLIRDFIKKYKKSKNNFRKQ